MLAVPLLLSVPGGGSDPGDEVVLAAGMPDGGPAEDAGAPIDGEAGVSLEAASVDEASTADDDRASRSPSTAWRTRSTSYSSASRKAAAGGGGGGKAKVKTTATTKKKAAVAAQATAAKVATARAAVAPPATAAPAPPPPPPPPPAPAPVAAPVAAPAPGADSAWDRLAVCESGNTNDHGAPYYGYWQFSAATWRSVGEPGLPDEHSREHQLAAAKRLHATRGWAPWPDCSRRLGLR